MKDADIERVAREWCRLAGVNPDETAQHGADPSPGTNIVPAILCYSPRWTRVAREVRSAAMMREAFEILESAAIPTEDENNGPLDTVRSVR